ncbi:MAG: hypothetical protein ACTSP9_03435 [Promethearchaeota archaeon]
MKFKKIEFARQTNFVVALLLIHFLFFGYLSNVYQKSIGEGVLYLYQVLFLPIPIHLSVLWLTIIVTLILCMAVLIIASKTEASDKKLLIILLALISGILIIPIALGESLFPQVLGVSIQVHILPDFSTIILAAIVFYMAFKEKFFEYGIRNSIWLVPFIMIQSWIWYWFIIESFDITIIGTYFLRIESYITILTLLGLNIFVALLASVAREKYDAFISRVKKIDV